MDENSRLLNDLEDCIDVFPRPIPTWKDPNGQGRDLLGLGFIPPGKRHEPHPERYFVRVDRFDLRSATTSGGEQITNVSVHGNALTGTILRDGQSLPVEGSAWAGAILTGLFRCPKRPQTEFPIQARVQSQPSRAPKQYQGKELVQWIYALELQVVSTWEPACHHRDDYAIPVAGYWDPQSNYQPRDDDAFSFSCQSAGAFKCLDRGYYSDAHSPPDDGLQLFEACTRMMRADYCGTGVSFTKDGSMVSAWDNRGHMTNRTETSKFGFEAAWTPRGATCYEHPRWPFDQIEPALGDPDKPRFDQCKTRLDRHAAVPACSTPEDAQAQSKGAPLLFNESCKVHPCLCDGEEQSQKTTHQQILKLQ